MEKIENIDFNALRDRAYQNAMNHGFHKEGDHPILYVMLIVSEIGEAINADRKGKYADRNMFEKNFDTPQVDPKGHWMFCFETFIKDSVEDELADSFIRLLDFAGWLELDLNENAYSQKDFELGTGELGYDKNITLQLYYTVKAIMDAKDVVFALFTLLAIAKVNDIDLLWHIEQKMKYNEMRPYKHGGKKY